MATLQVTDSSDWLETPLTQFAPLENALRCQVCKDFLKTPLITSCCHTFCSLCIRRCLSADGRCPICRLPEQTSKMRRNLVVEELVNAFQAARSAVMTLAKTAATDAYAQDRDELSWQQPRKRRKIHDDEQQARQTRSSSRRQQLSSQTPSIPENAADSADTAEDGLVACPMCGSRMKEALVFDHVGKCGQAPTPPSQPPEPDKPPIRLSTSSNQREPMSEIQFDLMRDPALRKKLQERGIPTWGSRELLKRRHTEWVNLWNAECDSEHPRSKRDLLRDLDVWERTLGGLAKDIGVTPSKGDFDAGAYAASHKDDFSRLIDEAKRKLKEKAAVESHENETTELVKAKTNGHTMHVESIDLTSSAPHADYAEDALDRLQASQVPCEGTTTVLGQK